MSGDTLHRRSRTGASGSVEKSAVTSPYTAGVFLPIAIVAGCLILVVVVHLATRQRPSKADLAVPEPGPAPSTAVVDERELAGWHRRHEAALLDFLETHDAWCSDPAQPVADADAVRAAAEGHPDPIARGELSAMVAAATTSVFARQRGDEAGADAHHETYLRYRALWSERLWQFRCDDARVRGVRQATVTPTLAGGG